MKPETTRQGTVFKFGGTSLGSIDCINRVASLCETHRPLAVVVSAMAGETNRLVALGSQISSETRVPEYDLLVSSGEQVSVALLSLALRKRGITPCPMLAPHAGICTDAHFSRAQITQIHGAHMERAISQGQLPIIAGFQGVTEQGQITSLGRGGSDTSAVAIAAALGAAHCVIYTDVDGVYTTDPRICPSAHIIRTISYEAMLEMASQGSKVLHIRCVQLAARWGVTLHVRNTFSDDRGTTMVQSHSKESLEGEVVSGIAFSEQETWITVGPMGKGPYVLAQVFECLAHALINVDIISINDLDDARCTLGFTLGDNDASLAQSILQKTFPGVRLAARGDVAKVSIVGVGMRNHAGVAAKMFRTLAEAGIDILLVTTSEIKAGCLIPREKLHLAVNTLHKNFLAPSPVGGGALYTGNGHHFRE